METTEAPKEMTYETACDLIRRAKEDKLSGVEYFLINTAAMVVAFRHLGLDQKE